MGWVVTKPKGRGLSRAAWIFSVRVSRVIHSRLASSSLLRLQAQSQEQHSQ